MRCSTPSEARESEQQQLRRPGYRDRPKTIAPPSFDGHGWLVVLYLAWTTTAAILAAMLVGKLVKDMIRHRDRDGWPTPAFIFWLIGVVGATGASMRCGIEVLSLWGWDPLDPVATAWFLTAKRVTDPVAITFGSPS